ncbi:hypothetical protein PY97_11405, partial [Lacticaseibacillus rhamnosus]
RLDCEPIALSAEEQARYFGQADSVAFNTLSDEDQVALMKLAQAEKVAISYVKKDRARVKQVFYLIPQLSAEQVAAEKQQTRQKCRQTIAIT